MTQKTFFIPEKLKAKILDIYPSSEDKELQEKVKQNSPLLEEELRERINYRLSATDVINSFEHGTEKLLYEGAKLAIHRIDVYRWYKKCLHAYNNPGEYGNR